MKKPKAIHLCECCDTRLTTKRKFCDERCTQLHEAKKVSAQKYKSTVARTFQKMIRAEAASQPAGFAKHYHQGSIHESYRHVGECVCITCGAVKPWNHKGMHAGHWIGRVHQSTLFEPDNLATQCDGCNEYRHGMPQEYLMWMTHVRGQSTIDRLLQLKHQPKQFSCHDLVDMRLEFNRRLKAAQAKLKGNQ